MQGYEDAAEPGARAEAHGDTEGVGKTMTTDPQDRKITFEGASNFRDLGSFQTIDGCSVKLRRVFRSGELQGITERDVTKLQNDIGLAAVLDLRNPEELERNGTVLTSCIGVKYFNIPLILGEPRDTPQFMESANISDVYLRRLEQPSFWAADSRIVGISC